MTGANHLIDGLWAGFAGREPAVFAELGDGRHYTYADLNAVSARFAAGLIELGVRPGDRVAAQVEKSIEALMLYLGTVRAGGVFLPLNTAYTPAEIGYFVGDAEPRLLVCDPARAEALRPIAEGVGARVETLGGSKGGSVPEGSLLGLIPDEAEGFSNVPRGPDDLAAILYTSGTTGRSKGAMLSHDNLLSNAKVLAKTWRFTGDDVLIHALPIFHTHGLFVASNTVIATAGRLIWMEKFDVDAVVAALPRATAMMGVPTFYTRLLADPRLDRGLTRDMRLFISGSAPLLAETHRQWQERTGHAILERYGMTECSMNTSNPYDGERRAGTVGFPLEGVELRITEPETGRALQQGEIGMIEVRGPNIFKGYWRMPEKTAEELRADGWFITGDLGMIDDRGYVVIVGRGKDLIITGGFNVYPKEVEGEIDRIPGVVESAVIGVPHPDFGEGVVAVVVPETGAGLSEKDILGPLAERLAKFKQPKRVIFAEALPRNTMGKVQKKELRDQHAGTFG
ncbi:malonyl-CoA synthase [Limibaculum sp. M0105]|uniref:Malonyl-CoA synthase n=1 Tax=Thermohalobaculum xanthum TaxID=2753746 RepID=A0A8J7M7M0_9RHOB|nr:malonyl-CoA synthase [Thermohalobaculum xanthum]MBK0399153.1 malonyl-CoA synthase [Thermohalobaculum xanthum]